MREFSFLWMLGLAFNSSLLVMGINLIFFVGGGSFKKVAPIPYIWLTLNTPQYFFH